MSDADAHLCSCNALQAACSALAVVFAAVCVMALLQGALTVRTGAVPAALAIAAVVGRWQLARLQQRFRFIDYNHALVA